jgi:diguanylate cyclase (GGDEF)-like protein
MEQGYRLERVAEYRATFGVVMAVIALLNVAMVWVDWQGLSGGALATALTVRALFVAGLGAAAGAAFAWPQHLTRIGPATGALTTVATLALTQVHGVGPGGPMGNTVQFAFIGLVFLVLLPNTWGGRILLAVLLVGATFWVAEATAGGAPASRVFMSELFVTGAVLMLLALGHREDRLRREQFAAELQLRALAESDPLTGTLNRRAFFSQAEREMARARREDEAVAVIMFDLDHFKEINDRHGHRLGDEVLKAVVERVRERLRPFDLLGRTGGEEFAVLLIDADEDQARQVADRLRHGVGREAVVRGGISVPVSISVGVSLWQDGASLDEALNSADERLYAAKEAGRDQVVAG